MDKTMVNTLHKQLDIGWDMRQKDQQHRSEKGRLLYAKHEFNVSKTI